MNYWIFIIAFASLALIVIAVLLIRKYIRTLTEKRVSAFQNDLVKKQYEEIQNIYAMMRGWRHDYKNHIQVMRASLEMGRLDELAHYLGELTLDLDSVDTIVKTDNIMADAILNSKIAICKTKAINVEVTAHIPDNFPLSDVNFCIIIGNLLDNAMDACMEIKNKKERFIRIYIGTFQENLYISVTNSMAGKLKKRGKTYKTTKGKDHGFGLISMDRIIRKHNGYVNRQHEEGVFGTEIMIPFANE